MSADDPAALHTLERVAFARRDGLSLQVEVLRLEELLRPPHKRATTAPTRAEFHHLLLIEGGSSGHWIDFERRRVDAGDLLVIPAGRVQAFDRARRITGYLALFTPEYLEQAAFSGGRLSEAAGLLLGESLLVSLGPAALARAQTSFQTLDACSRASGAERYVADAIAAAFSHLLFTLVSLPETVAAVAARAPADRLVAAFDDLLERRFREQHQAAPYAAALGVSLRTLDRHLLAARAQTARQAISARIMLEAKRLLTRRDVAIKQVAYALGFPEPQNFTRFVRAATGMPPRALRDTLA